MPSYTTSLRLVQPATGEYSGTWGTQVNNGITALVDTSVAGTASITMTAADYTLSTANGATDEARAMFLVLGGAPGAARNVICPAVSKLYFVTNNTGFAQTVKTAAGTGISVPNGASMTLRCDGTNVVEALNAFGNLTINTGKVLLPNTQSYAIKTSTGSSNDVVTLNASNVLILGGGGATDSIQFWNQGLQRMTLDSSGNLGLGVTPDAWQSGYRSYTMQYGGSLATTTGIVQLGQNYFYNASSQYIYRTTDFASFYRQTSGQHQWFTAPSGTSGNAISFTQAMTLDASGNLGIGTSSPAATAGLTVSKASNAAVEAVVPTVAAIAVGYNNSGSANVWGAPTGTAFLATPQSVPITLVTNATERARITSGGDLLVGKTTPTNGEKFAVRGSGATSVPTNLSDLNGALALVDCSVGNTAYGAFGFQSAGGGGVAVVLGRGTAYDTNILFCTNPSTTTTSGAMTERARITSGGDWLVGTATVSGAGGLTYLNQGATGFASINNNNAGATGYVFSSYRRSSVEIGSVTQNGTTAVLFNTTSDRRLKENITPAPSASDVIDAIEIVSHDWKAAPDEHVTYGVIAQDLALVAPQAVLQGDDGNEIERTWGVDYSKLVPMLIKEIQSLRARVAALEAK